MQYITESGKTKEPDVKRVSKNSNFWWENCKNGKLSDLVPQYRARRQDRLHTLAATTAIEGVEAIWRGGASSCLPYGRGRAEVSANRMYPHTECCWSSYTHQQMTPYILTYELDHGSYTQNNFQESTAKVNSWKCLIWTSIYYKFIQVINIKQIAYNLVKSKLSNYLCFQSFNLGCVL